MKAFARTAAPPSRNSLRSWFAPPIHVPFHSSFENRPVLNRATPPYGLAFPSLSQKRTFQK